jgi:hypothetical protein
MRAMNPADAPSVGLVRGTRLDVRCRRGTREGEAELRTLAVGPGGS